MEWEADTNGTGDRETGAGREAADAEPEVTEEHDRDPWKTPFSDLGDLVGEFLDNVRAFPSVPLRGPRLDLVRTPVAYLVLVDLPGVDRQDVEVTLRGDELTIAGRRRRGDWPAGAETVRGEREHGRFRRTVHLFSDADASGVRARLQDGVLRITVPRRGEAEPQRVDVEG